MRPNFENLNGIYRSEHPGYHCSIIFFVLLLKSNGRQVLKKVFSTYIVMYTTLSPSLNNTYITMYTTLHYTTLHYTTLHYTTLHYTTLHYTTLHYTTLHYTTLPSYAIVIAINVRPYRRSTGYMFSCSGRLRLRVSDKIQLFSSLRNHSYSLCPHIVLAANRGLQKGRLRVRCENNP